MGLIQIVKAGKVANAFLTSNSTNGTVTDSRGNAVTDLATNTAYSVVVATAQSAPTLAVIQLPPIEGNWAVVNNQTGSSIAVQGSSGDPYALSIANGEVAHVSCLGNAYGSYQKTTGTSSSFDIGSLGSYVAPMGTDLMLIKSGSTQYKITFANLAAGLGLQNINPGNLLAPVHLVYLSNVANLSSPGFNQDSQSLTLNQRALLAAQAVGTQNGVYYWNGSTLVRSADLPTAASASGKIVQVYSAGGNFGNTYWICTAPNGSDIVGTNSLTFKQTLTDHSIGGSSDVQSAVIAGGSNPNANTNKLVSVSSPVIPWTAANALAAQKVTPVTVNQIVQELAQTAGNVPVLWSHYKNVLGRATKFAKFVIADEYTFAATGTTAVITLLSTDVFWQVHTGRILLHVHDPGTGRDFQKLMPFSAIYNKRMRISDGNGSAGAPIQRDLNGCAWWGSDMTNDTSWPIISGSSDPYIAITPYWSSNQYGLNVISSPYSSGPGTFEVVITVDVVCIDTGVTQG